MLTLAGEANAAARAKAIMDFETAIAKVSWTREDVGDATKTYNKMTLAQLAEARAGLRLGELSQGAVGKRQRAACRRSRARSQAIAALSAKAPLQVLKDQLIVQSLDTYADVLPKAVADENFAFYGTKLNGTPENQPRWKRAVDFTTNILDRRRVASSTSPNGFRRNPRRRWTSSSATSSRRWTGASTISSWMAPETKVKAKAKLAAFTPQIGYPEPVARLSRFDVRRDDLFGNAMRANQWSHDWNIHKLGQPIYRWEWGMTR